MKTFVGAVVVLGNYQIVTIDEETKKDFDFAFEVNWQETGASTHKYAVHSLIFPVGGFDIKVFRKGESGDFVINGWKFFGSFSGSYELKAESNDSHYIESYSNINVTDPEGKIKNEGFSGCEGPMSFYALMVLKYLNLIFKYCLYKNIDEAELVSRAYTSYILRSSFDSPEELLKQLSQLQIISRSIKNLDNCEDIPNHVKDAARQKYKSLITQIKDLGSTCECNTSMQI